MPINRRFNAALGQEPLHQPEPQRLLKVGQALTKPFLREVNIATQIFGPNHFPGREPTWKDRVFIVLRGIELFTLVAPIIFGLIALVGIALKCIAVQWAPSNTYLERENRPRRDDIHNFTIMSYNTCLMAGYGDNFNNVLPNRQRAPVIAAEVNRENPAIACFQEVFHSRSTYLLCDNLNYPYILHSVAPNESFLNSGLVIASRYPITRFSYRYFENGVGEDKLANKGLLGAEIALPDGTHAMIYNTHLQAGDHPEERTAQLAQIHAWMAEDRESGEFAFTYLVGDFNEEGAVDIDGFTDLNEGEGTFYDDPVHHQGRTRRLDRIFGEVGQTRVIDSVGSDHAMLLLART